MAERIGLKGTSALCTLGRPYSIPGLEPVGQSILWSSSQSSEIRLSFFRPLRKFLSFVSRLVAFNGSDVRVLNLVESLRMIFIFWL